MQSGRFVTATKVHVVLGLSIIQRRCARVLDFLGSNYGGLLKDTHDVQRSYCTLFAATAADQVLRDGAYGSIVSSVCCPTEVHITFAGLRELSSGMFERFRKYNIELLCGYLCEW